MPERKAALIDALEAYILDALKNPTSPGNKVELVPELIGILSSLSGLQFHQDV